MNLIILKSQDFKIIRFFKLVLLTQYLPIRILTRHLKDVHQISTHVEFCPA